MVVIIRSLHPRIHPVQTIVTLLMVGLTLASAASYASAQTKTATATTLTITAGGTSVINVASGTVVTLTAAVNAGPTAITTGKVNFCDASATYCTDIHILGIAQLTSAGTATLKLRPSIGSHSYKAVFLGTDAYAPSAAGSSEVTVTGKYPTTTTITQGGTIGNYTLTVTVSSSATAAPGPTGQISLVDITSGNAALSAGALENPVVGPALVSASNVQVGNGPGGIVAGDFNEDGNLDLAVELDNPTQPLGILLGDGTGNFTAAPASSGTATGSPVLVQDFNGDGIPDILLSVETSGLVTVLLGNGDGTFRVAPGSPIATNYGSYPVVVADVNGDGIPDLALAGGYYLVVLLGKGDGTFTEVPISSSSISGADLFGSMVEGDFNGDGIPDLAALDLSGETVSVYFGNGDGTFKQGASITTTTTGAGSPITLTAGDFNGDGKLDLAVPIYGSTGSVAILLGNGDGTFSQASGSPIPVEAWANRVAVGDFNGDGIPDLFIGAQTNGTTLNILQGAGNGTFSQMPTGSAGLPCCSNTVLGDFNSDGLTDIASSSFYDGTAQLLVAQFIQAATTESGINPPGPGTQQVEASYPGDNNFSGSVSGTTALTPSVAMPRISPAPGQYAGEQTIEITEATPGAMIYYNAAGIVNTNGFVAYTGPIALTMAGTESIQFYASETGYATSATAAGTYTIALGTAAATISVTPSATNVTNAQAVTVTAAVSGSSGQPTPSGSVTLSVGSWSDRQTLSAGDATFTVPAGTLNSGSNTLTAQYSGDATYAVVSGTATITASQVVSTAQTPSAISPGGSVTSTISLSAGSTYSGTMNLTCELTSSPQGAQSLPTCKMKPTSVTLTSGGNDTSMLTVETTAGGTTALLHPSSAFSRWFGGGEATLVAILLFGIPPRRRRWTSIFVLLLAVFAFGAAGCGGGEANSGGNGGETVPATTAGNYTFTVTGTDSVSPQITTSITVVFTVR